MNKSNLELIPKYERYMEYVINMILKIPRVEKYNIGSQLKIAMYEMMENIVYLNKISREEKLSICNYIDARILIQRIYIRIMYKQRYVDERKYMTSIGMLDEIGRMLGGYIKSIGIVYGKEK